ncbi:unnamed protein product [Medioppia subpectinata]|uniref:Uncharacterized protein n=1 Tax=Medioppia subpectinata TaxID=1979941 RepID=A0A7R9KJN8_9ACAR|nr:unnamed protein product [Medioppia subpectinata]CAG2104757.1 unnamed protein product [Medioppia subpectinata]
MGSTSMTVVWFSNRRARWRKQMGSQQLNGFSAALATLPAMHAYSSSATNPYLQFAAAAQVDPNHYSNASQALTSDGRVYAWGQNMFGQIGCTDVDHGSVYVPKELGFNENCQINSVYCSLYSSFAITTDGQVFSWGRNHWYNLGHNNYNVWTPTAIHDKNTFELTGGKHSAGVGTVGFQAPEVSRGLPYNHLSDVFSLSKIGEILFDLDISDVDPDCPGIYSSNEMLNKSWYNLVEVLAEMYSTPRWESRPECSQVQNYGMVCEANPIYSDKVAI